jgi:hypothetical protein
VAAIVKESNFKGASSREEHGKPVLGRKRSRQNEGTLAKANAQTAAQMLAAVGCQQ